MIIARLVRLVRFGVFRSVSLLYFSSLAAAAFAFLNQVLLARQLTPSYYGALAAALATVNLFIPLAGFGIQGLWLKVFGIEGWDARRWLKPSLRFVIFSSMASCVLVLLWAAGQEYGDGTRILLLLLTPLVVGQALSDLVSGRLQLEERYKHLSLWQLAPHVGRLLLVLAAFVLGASVIEIAAGYAAIAVMMAAYAGYLLWLMLERGIQLRGHGPVPSASDLGSSKLPPVRMLQIPQLAWPFALGGVFYLIYFQSDIILLNWLVGAEAAGIYNVAFTVLAAVYILPGVIYQKYLLPKLHRWAEHDRQRFLSVFRAGNGSMLLFGIVIMVALIIVIPWLLPVVFGPEYSEASSLVRLLAICVPARFLAASLAATLTTQEHIRRKIGYMFIAAVLNVVLNLILIPKYSFFGAAIATIASEWVLLCLFLIDVRYHVFGAEAWRNWTIRIKSP